VPHSFVTALQHWLPKQSAFELQQVSTLQEPPQHFCPPGHCASLVHRQFSDPQVFVAESQHWFARQSLFEQQLPGMHCRMPRAGLPLPAAPAPATDCGPPALATPPPAVVASAPPTAPAPPELTPAATLAPESDELLGMLELREH
jgi:hypothetical protein